MYAIIDVETTGLNARSERITEIAILIHDGKKVVDRYETLINPGKRISNAITGLTGIDNKMVSDAPFFHDIARTIVELTENKIIVGHNVSFDYSFIRHEFRRLFYDFKRKTVCTKKLARRLLPGRRSYGLGSLCNDLDIANIARHRAGGDAMATMELFTYLISLEDNLLDLSLQHYKSGLDRDKIEYLPAKTGVYYFLNKEGDIIYIGKSKNIRERVISHLNNNITKRAIDMRDQLADIHYEITGSELIALLLESHEIKKHKPLFNRSQRRASFPYGLFDYPDDKGYINLNVRRIKVKESPLLSYASAKEGREHLNFLLEKYDLCQRFCGLHKASGPCFHYQIHRCNGACAGIEPPAEYNERVEKAIERYLYQDESFYIVDEGREKDERAVIKVSNGHYCGFGFMNINETSYAEAMMDCIRQYPENRDTHVILKGYLGRHKDQITILKLGK